MYISKLYYKNLPDKIEAVTPRDRFVQYYTDLYNVENSVNNGTNAADNDYVDSTTYLKGAQYNHAKLGTSVLNLCEEDGVFKNLELMATCYWAHEFDPDHCSCNAYFCDRYKIHGIIYDICDCGILSPIIALSTIKKYFECGKITNALLLCLDQNTIPISKNFKGLIPQKTSALAMLIEKNPPPSSATKYQILDAKISHKKNLDETIANYMLQSELVTVIGDQETTIKNIHNATSKISTENNCAEIFQPLINGQLKNLQENENFILNIFDVESNDCGIIFGKTFS